MPLKTPFSVWFRAVRPFAFSASALPVILAAALGMLFHESINWMLLPLVFTCSLLFHAATNLFNDYFDFKKGVDKKVNAGSSGVLVEGLLLPRQIYKAGWVLFGIGFSLGLILVWLRGLPMLILGIIGLLGGYFYTGGPIHYKYFALGDCMVFFLMGPLMVIGSYYAFTGTYDHRALLVSLPVGLLVAAILHSNNMRDIQSDKQARIKTFASLIGHKASKFEYDLLLIGSYSLTILLMIWGILPLWSLLVFLSLPLAIRNMKKVAASSLNSSKTISLIDVYTAKLHLTFGILLSLSILLGAIFT